MSAWPQEVYDAIQAVYDTGVSLRAAARAVGAKWGPNVGQRVRQRPARDTLPVLHPDAGLAYVPLAGGASAIIDIADAALVGQYIWQLHPDGYATSVTGGAKVWMHRLLVGLDGSTPGVQCDHRSGCRLDNRRSNLRVCTPAENARNMRPRKGSTTKGVSWCGRLQKWKAGIGLNGKKIHLGYFTDKREAALAYNAAAVVLHGEFARLNEVL